MCGKPLPPFKKDKLEPNIRRSLHSAIEKTHQQSNITVQTTASYMLKIFD